MHSILRILRVKHRLSFTIKYSGSSSPTDTALHRTIQDRILSRNVALHWLSSCLTSGALQYLLLLFISHIFSCFWPWWCRRYANVRTFTSIISRCILNIRWMYCPVSLFLLSVLMTTLIVFIFFLYTFHCMFILRTSFDYYPGTWVIIGSLWSLEFTCSFILVLFLWRWSSFKVIFLIDDLFSFADVQIDRLWTCFSFKTVIKWLWKYLVSSCWWSLWNTASASNYILLLFGIYSWWLCSEVLLNDYMLHSLSCWSTATL